MAIRSFLLVIILVLFFSGSTKNFAPGVINIQAFDLHDRPMSGVVFGIKGGYNSRPTTSSGQTEIKVPTSVLPASKLDMMLISTNIKGMEIVSPWKGNFTVPSFDNNPNNTVYVYLAIKGDKLALSDPKVIKNLTREINGLNQQFSPTSKSYQNDVAKTVAEVSDLLAVSPQELDKSIRDGTSQLTAFPVPEYDEMTKQIALYKKMLPGATNKYGPNISGEWTGVIKSANGSEIPVTYRLNLKSHQLTGTITSPLGESVIKNGQIDGDSFTFDVGTLGGYIQLGRYKTDSLVVKLGVAGSPTAVKLDLVRMQ